MSGQGLMIFSGVFVGGAFAIGSIAVGLMRCAMGSEVAQETGAGLTTDRSTPQQRRVARNAGAQAAADGRPNCCPLPLHLEALRAEWQLGHALGKMRRYRSDWRSPNKLSPPPQSRLVAQGKEPDAIDDPVGKNRRRSEPD